MADISITEAIKSLSTLCETLENAYWDSSHIDTKDRIFDLVSCVHGELNELAKLSVNDLNLPYECITPTFGQSCVKIRKITSEVHQLFPRTATATSLEHALIGAGNLLKSCEV